MPKNRTSTIFLVLLTAVALYFCYIIAKPFLQPVALAGVMTIVFYPLHSRIVGLIRNTNVAAFVSMFLIFVIILIPALALGGAITKELSNVYQSLAAKSAETGGLDSYLRHLFARPIGWLGHYVDLSKLDLRAALQDRVEQASGFLLKFVAHLASNVTSFLLDATVAFFTLFFLLRDGETLVQRIAHALPLDSVQVERLFRGISDAIIANVHGVLAVASAQGFLLSLAFWALGLSSPVLWGVATAVCSLIPVLGSALIWIPASISLIVSGGWWKGLALFAWGALGVGLVDNFLRPFVISGRVRINTLYVFFALLGGVEAFGLIGLFIGPIVLSVTMALLDMLKEERLTWHLGGIEQRADASNQYGPNRKEESSILSDDPSKPPGDS